MKTKIDNIYYDVLLRICIYTCNTKQITCENVPFKDSV